MVGLIEMNRERDGGRGERREMGEDESDLWQLLAAAPSSRRAAGLH